MKRSFISFKFPPGIFTCELRGDPRDDLELNSIRSTCFSHLLGMTQGRVEVPQSPPSSFVEWHLDHFSVDQEELAVATALAFRDNIPHANLPWSVEELQAAIRAVRALSE